MKYDYIEKIKQDNIDKKIWYVAYDIDISKDEFSNYIKKCKNATKPEKDKAYILRAGSYYTGFDETGRWNNGGHVYLRKDLVGVTFGHAYEITEDQLVEIYEMKKKEYRMFMNKESTLDIVLMEKDGDESYYTISETELCEFNAPSKKYIDCLIDGIHELYPHFSKSILETYAYYHAVPGWCLDVIDYMLCIEWIKESDIWYQCRYVEDMNQLQMMVDNGMFLKDGDMGNVKYKLNPSKVELARRLLLFKRIDSVRIGCQYIEDVQDPKYIAALYDKPISIKCRYREIESIQDPEYFIKSHYYSNLVDDMSLEDWPLFSNMEDRFEYSKGIIENVELEDGENINNKKIYGYLIGLAQSDVLLLASMKFWNKPIIQEDPDYIDEIVDNTNFIHKIEYDNDGECKYALNEEEIDTLDSIVMYALLSRTYNMCFAYELAQALDMFGV